MDYLGTSSSEQQQVQTLQVRKNQQLSRAQDLAEERLLQMKDWTQAVLESVFGELEEFLSELASLVWQLKLFWSGIPPVIRQNQGTVNDRNLVQPEGWTALWAASSRLP